MVCIQCVKRSRKNEVRTYHRGPFHRASQSVYCTCGDQWAGGNGSCKEYRQVQGASDPGYTGFSGKEQQSGEKDSL